MVQRKGLGRQGKVSAEARVGQAVCEAALHQGGLRTSVELGSLCRRRRRRLFICARVYLRRGGHVLGVLILSEILVWQGGGDCSCSNSF